LPLRTEATSPIRALDEAELLDFELAQGAEGVDAEIALLVEAAGHTPRSTPDY